MGKLIRLLEALGLRERASTSPAEGASAIPNLPLWNQFHRIGGGLSPIDVSFIIRQADDGRPSRLIDLANDSRQKDGHLHGCLEQAEQAIAGLPWELVPPEDATATERKAAKQIESTLRNCPSFDTAISHAAGSFYYGHSVSEMTLRLDGGKLFPHCFVNHDARRFGFRQEDGGFVWRDDGMMDGVDLRQSFPDQFVICQPRVTGDVPAREGLARILVWAALFRSWTLSDWLKLAEIAWKPWRIGTYKKGADKRDIDGLLDVLETMSTNGVARVPETISVDVKWAPNSSTKPLHEVLFETVAREMSKTILGQTETISSSTSSGYAQAKVHNEVRKDLRESRAKQVSSVMTRDVVEPLTRLNYPPRVRHARLRLGAKDPVDLVGFSTGVKNLVEAGTKIPQSYVRETAGIPEPKEGEETLDTSTPVPGPPGQPGEPGAPGDPGPEGPQGAQGEKGAPGERGPKGDTGAIGPRGETGAQGLAGLQGPQGLAGAKGPQGDQGVQGPEGARGRDGRDGVDGKAAPYREPTEIERQEHISRMTASLIADIREARTAGVRFNQDAVDKLAQHYGVPSPKVEEV